MGRAPEFHLATEDRCQICDWVYSFRWTDTHGIGACTTCGAPYKIYHYEGDGEGKKRVNKPPQLLILDQYIPLTKKYWDESKKNVAPGAFNMPGSFYEVATRDDAESLRAFERANKDEYDRLEKLAAE